MPSMFLISGLECKGKSITYFAIKIIEGCKLDKIKVLIADPHYMFIRGIESILADDKSLEIVGTTQNGQEAYELAKEYGPNIMIMDVGMPVINGLQTLKIMKSELPEVSVLMLTVEDNEEQLFEALRSGAKGYFLKTILPNELLTFIHMIYRGETVITGPAARKMIESVANQQPLGLRITANRKIKTNILTKREKEILAQVMKGLTNREIAEVLDISENTVKNHLRNIMEKLQMNNRVQAAAFALQEGWL